MSRTDQQRYEEALAYLQKLNQQLRDEVNQKIANKPVAGKEISLEGAGYWYRGSGDQHSAVRAYLLCLIAYFRPPHATRDDATFAVGQERTRMAGKSVVQVNEEILNFLPKPGASLQDLVNAALRVNNTSAPLAFYGAIRTRHDDTLGPNPICYDGVMAWLYAAGFISKRWLAKAGQLNGNNSNQFLGDGQVVDRTNWDKIPAGYIWNIHKKGDKTTCHWGVSLGNNKAVACNNTSASPGHTLAYEDGGRSQYGKFRFTNICDVLNNDQRYQLPGGKNHATGINIEVRQINPSAAGYY